MIPATHSSPKINYKEISGKSKSCDNLQNSHRSLCWCKWPVNDLPHVKIGCSLVVQWVKDLELSLQQLGLPLWHEFYPWPRKFHMLWMSPPPQNIYIYISRSWKSRIFWGNVLDCIGPSFCKHITGMIRNWPKYSMLVLQKYYLLDFDGCIPHYTSILSDQN